jgi:hypothetical protein
VAHQLQPKFDLGRAMFTYEDMTGGHCRSRSANTVDEVVGVLATAIRVAWITEDENKQVHALGYSWPRRQPPQSGPA